MLATSAEFCLGAEQDARDCESVQFISGIALAAPYQGPSSADRLRAEERLLLSVGVNDCEAKVGTMAMRRVWQMLHLLSGAADACEVER